jgi:hypothetical protein
MLMAKTVTLIITPEFECFRTGFTTYTTSLITGFTTI